MRLVKIPSKEYREKCITLIMKRDSIKDNDHT